MASKAALRQVSPAPTIGALIDQLKKLDLERAELNKVVDAKKAERDELERQIIESMDKQDTRVGEGKVARASIQTSEEPQIEDWDTALAFLAKTKNLHLVQRRLSAPAWRELRALKHKEVPGVGIFVKRSLRLTAVSK